MSPIIKKKMNALRKEYGKKKWEDVYYAMENKMKKMGKKMPMHKKK